MKEAFQFLASMQNQEEKTRKYWIVKVRINQDRTHTPIAQHGQITIKPSQIKQYQISLGCTLMRHLPASLKEKDSE